jgi:FdrA protein
VAKAPDPEVAERQHRILVEIGKPAVVRYLGQPPRPAEDGVVYASTLDEAADLAVMRVQVEAAGAAADKAVTEPEETLPVVTGRLVGLFSGGSLAAEAREILRRHAIEARVPDPLPQPGQAFPADHHLVLDVGEDVYTRGRPHPMVDQGVRLDLLEAAGRDPSIGVVLMDLVLGDGAHPDPAPEWLPVLEAMRRERGDDAPVIVASLCGSDADPQGLARQRATLEAAGVRVHPSAARAVSDAARLLGGRGEA